MLQRIQSIYLFLAVVLYVVCLMLPIGVAHSGDLSALGASNTTIYNLGSMQGGQLTGGFISAATPMFIILVTAAALALINIFGYKNRRLQILVCNICIFLSLVWVAYALVYGFALLSGFSLRIAFAMPIVSMILIFLARGRIKHDEELVRASDRIR